MKLLVFKYDDGTVTYGTHGIKVLKVGKEIAETIEIEEDEEKIKDILVKPQDYEVKKNSIIEKKKIK